MRGLVVVMVVGEISAGRQVRRMSLRAGKRAAQGVYVAAALARKVCGRWG